MRQLIRIVAVVMVGACIPTTVAWGDVVHLKDGTKIEGDVKKTDEGYVVIADDGTRTDLPAAKVQRIELVSAQGQDAATAGLSSLRRSAESMSDIDQILARYERFIDKNSSTTAADEAAADVVLWKQRKAEGLVKFAGKWISPEERDATQLKSHELAAKALELIKQSKHKDADPLIQQSLGIDTQNPTALYLRALRFYQLDSLVPARKSLETVNALLPDFVSVLNNLAVIVWKQNQHMAALNYYLAAMQAGPPEKVVLNNVAEALQALPKDQRDNAITKKVIRIFNEQDARLQEQLATAGWYRWGSTWVNQEQLKKLKAIEKDVKDKLDAIAEDFEDAQVKVAEIDSSIDDNERTMRNLEARSYYRDKDGDLHRATLPAVYYDIQRDNTRLQADRDKIFQEMEQMRTRAKGLKAQLPVPQYTGNQQFIAEEGTPLPMPAQPQAQPQVSAPAPARAAPVPAVEAPAAQQPATEPATAPAK